MASVLQMEGRREEQPASACEHEAKRRLEAQDLSSYFQLRTQGSGKLSATCFLPEFMSLHLAGSGACY